jgi:hypothetical protein
MTSSRRESAKTKAAQHKSKSWYEILDVPREATQADLDLAYEKALAKTEEGVTGEYGPLGHESRQKVLRDLEVAFLTLSDPKKREELDAELDMQQAQKETSMVPTEEKPKRTRRKSASKKTASKKRTTKKVAREKTTATKKRKSRKKTSNSTPVRILAPVFDEILESEYLSQAPHQASSEADGDAIASSTENHEAMKSAGAEAAEVAGEQAKAENLESADDIFTISGDTEVTGDLIRQVRQARGLSIQDVADATRIQKGYIRAIEEMRTEELPARVYLRGYLIQIGRTLGVNRENLAKGYMALSQRF